MDTMLRRRAMIAAGGSTPPTPPSYDAEVEWLENDTLGEYINTGLSPTNKTGVFISVKDFAGTSQFLFGGRVGTDSSTFGMGSHNDTQIRFDYGTGSANQVKYSYTGGLGEHILGLDRKVCTVDGTTVKTFSQSSFTNAPAIHLFGINNNGTHVDMLKKVKIKLVQFYTDGVLSMELIPVRIGSVGAMFDTVGRQLYYNQGSGAFTFGNDK